MTHCTDCDCELHDDETRWAFDVPYCEDCFYDNYTYCQRCDTLINREEAQYEDEDPMCSDCYEDSVDHDAPVNPMIDNTDRKLILNLCNNWLNGKQTFRAPIKINNYDPLLPELKEKVGLIRKQLYVYGLQDREDYQIKASTDIFNLVSQYTALNGWDVKLSEDTGTGRIGICKSLRENKLRDLVKLIKSI